MKSNATMSLKDKQAAALAQVDLMLTQLTALKELLQSTDPDAEGADVLVESSMQYVSGNIAVKDDDSDKVDDTHPSILKIIREPNSYHSVCVRAADKEIPKHGVCSRYSLSGFDTARNLQSLPWDPRNEVVILFANDGPVQGVSNGIAIEDLLAICEHRLACLQHLAGPPNEDFDLAYSFIREAIKVLATYNTHASLERDRQRGKLVPL